MSFYLFKLKNCTFNRQPSFSSARYAYTDSRLPPSTSSHQTIKLLKEGDDCEVLTEAKNESEPSGWWPATVKMVKGEFFVVDYKIQDDAKYSDIVPSDKIRVPNKKY